MRASSCPENLTLLFAGDCCPRNNAQQIIAEGKAADIFAPIQDILQSADVSLIQFETPLTSADTPICKSGPNLKCLPNSVELLKAWGGQVTLLANNHIGDFGSEATCETIDILQQNGFRTVGAGKNLEDARRPLIFKEKGLTLGIINLAENEFGGALPDQAGANPLFPFYNLSQIQELKREVDLCIVVTHGGNEHNPVPSPRVVTMSHAFVDAGADLVVNIHTHCPQGIETWHGKPIVYSLGNFFFPNAWADQYDPQNFWYTGYMLRCKADRQGVFQVEAIPTHFGLPATCVEALQGDEKAAFLTYLSEISGVLDDWKNITLFHEAWAAGKDNYVAKFICQASWKEEDFQDPDKKQSLMPLRNIFTCEAHHELACTWLKLFEQGRLEKAAEFLPELKKLQKATFIQH
ncbi:MAG: CapA family protein [Lentisphaeria bacterium]